VTAAYDEPARLDEFDQLCDAFLTSHVANRASRSQGRALLSAVERVFPERGFQAATTTNRQMAVKQTGDQASNTAMASYGHFSPMFGAIMKSLDLSRAVTLRLFFFSHIRGLLAAAVRLNIVGPMEAQSIQHRLGPRAVEILLRCETLTLADLAQTSPLLDLWQSTHDRLYSRLFQS